MSAYSAVEVERVEAEVQPLLRAVELDEVAEQAERVVLGDAEHVHLEELHHVLDHVAALDGGDDGQERERSPGSAARASANIGRAVAGGMPGEHSSSPRIALSTDRRTDSRPASRPSASAASRRAPGFGAVVRSLETARARLPPPAAGAAFGEEVR